MKTWSLASLLSDFGQWMTMDELYSFFVTLPIIKKAWKRGDKTDYRRQRRLEFQEIREKAISFLDAHNLQAPRNHEEQKVIIKEIGRYLWRPPISSPRTRTGSCSSR